MDLIGDDVLGHIRKLEEQATEVLKLKKESRPRRPIVIEFCGSPKSGKTTCISALNIFLKRNNFKTLLLTERASICPVPDKQNPMFNVWTACAAITQLVDYLSNKSKEVDIIIADRAIFDALCWFEWLLENGHLDADNYNTLVNFLTMKKFRSIIDLIYIFEASPQVSMEREYSCLLTRKTGSIMNIENLQSYNDSINVSVDKHGSKFAKISRINTSNLIQTNVGAEVTNVVMKSLHELTVEKIGYISIDELSEFQEDNHFYYNDILKKDLRIKYGMRDEVESDPNKIQPIPIVTITNKKRDRLLILKKKEESLGSKSPEKNKTLVYAGGHVRKEDNVDGDDEDFLTIIKTTLMREIYEELGLSLSPAENNPLVIWVKNIPKSKQHLAICFIIETDLDNLALKFDDYEFVQKTSGSKSGKILPLYELKEEKIESWGRIILEEVFNVTFDDQQLSLI